MCPALMLAASRKDRVIGRTRVLTVSIKIRNGLSQAGAPPGRRDARVVEGLKHLLEIINLSQRGSPKDSVKIKWEEELKTYGITPIKLIVVIKMYRATRRVVRPFRFVVEVRLPCWFIISVGIDKSQNSCLGEAQNKGCRNARVIKLIAQNIIGEKLKMEVVAGSKEEKISTIIKVYQYIDIACFEGRQFFLT